VNRKVQRWEWSNNDDSRDASARPAYHDDNRRPAYEPYVSRARLELELEMAYEDYNNSRGWFSGNVDASTHNHEITIKLEEYNKEFVNNDRNTYRKIQALQKVQHLRMQLDL